ncbi:MAG: type II secretion system protein N [Parvularcula sp.]|jgi:hypothetical protein|nr:type II secretion system protein N [Parvularcula sp.]
MKTVAIVLLAIVVFVGVFVWRLPLDVVTGRLPVSYASAEGTVWSGRLTGVQANGEPLGDVRFDTDPLSLLGGAPAARFAVSGASVTGEGRAQIGGDWLSLENADLTLDLRSTGMIDPLGRPVSGNLEVDVGKLTFGRDRCSVDATAARTDALVSSMGAFGSRGFPLEGVARCEGNILVLPLSGEGPDAAIDAVVRVEPSGRYVTSLTVAPKSPELGRYLRGLGFAEQDGAFTQTREGRYQTLWR